MSRERNTSARRGFVRAAMALGVLALAVAAVVAASDVAQAMGGRHWGRGGHDPAEMKEHMALAMDHVLRRLDASEEQRERVKEIATATFDAVAPLADSHKEHRDRMFELLGADEIDREALEELRAAELALADQASRAFVSGLADLAETLTSEQRTELLEHRHGGGHGWRRHRGW